MLNNAHEGYSYQDLLCAYFVAKYIAAGKLDVAFLFDKKLFDEDKFDDFKVFDGDSISFYQIKHSNETSGHHIEKTDFSTSSAHDLYLFDLYKSWLKQNSPQNNFRLCLAWNSSLPDDSISDILIPISSANSLFMESKCFKIDCDKLWDIKTGLPLSWRNLKNDIKEVDRSDFKLFLDSLVIETCCPKLSDGYQEGLNAYLYKEVKKIGIGKYPNDHLSVEEVCNDLRRLAEDYRSQEKEMNVTAREIAQKCGIKLNFGGIDEVFPIDKTLYVDIPERIQFVKNNLDKNKHIVVTAEPGAGKSWFIDSFEEYLHNEKYVVLKHYCYTSLEDKEFLKRVKVNTFLGSLKEQIVNRIPKVEQYSEQKYASSIEEINSLLKHISQKTVIIVDGIDHIRRLYAKDNYFTSESEIDVISVIQTLDLSNPNLYMLLISQPLEDLKLLQGFCHIDLPPISLDFVKTYMRKINLHDYESNGAYLSHEIYEKSNGNALYCKYLLDHAFSIKGNESFDWLETLPAYDFNLKSYYHYLYEKLDGDISVVAALCGVDFSLSEEELGIITGLGSLVETHLSLLLPILRYTSSYGFAVYHESFKRYIFNLFEQNKVDIKKKVYYPLIVWLESYDFFDNRKTYASLLKFYYEIGEYNKILNTVSIDFIENSIYHVCSFTDIRKNFHYQKMALPYATDFKFHIILSELSKTISILDDFDGMDEIIINYLDAAKVTVGTETIYHFIQRENNEINNFDIFVSFLVEQSFSPNEEVHWELCKFGRNFDLRYAKDVVIRLLYLKQYEAFDDFILYLHDHYQEYYRQAFLMVERWICVYGKDWLVFVPKFNSLYNCNNNISLKSSIEALIKSEKIHYNNDWFNIIQNIEQAARNASEPDVEEAIKSLQNYNWFRNWIIYIILINRQNSQDRQPEKIISAFSYLVRDLSPFKGTPRTCDLYMQLPYIKISYRKGLTLCNGDKYILKECLDLLHKVTETTTSLDNSKSGPLTEEDFFDLILDYLPEDYQLETLEKEIQDSSFRGYYHNLANLFFRYSVILFKQNKKHDSEYYYKLGVQALLGYGFHKDISIYEVLDCLIEYTEYTGLTSKSQIFDLYVMTKTIIMHTDGRDTKNSPVEWFEKLCKLSTESALAFLVTDGISKIHPMGYFEEYLSYFLDNTNTLLSNDEWFLLCQTAPLLCSEQILSKGMSILDKVSNILQGVCFRWAKCLPFVQVNKDSESSYFSDDTMKKYFDVFNIEIPKKEEKGRHLPNYSSPMLDKERFSATSLDDAIEFFRHETLYDEDIEAFIQFLLSLDFQSQKELIIAFLTSIGFSPKCKIETVLNLIDNNKLKIFLKVGYFIYKSDGYLKTMTEYKYLKSAYIIDKNETLRAFKEILGFKILHSEYPLWQSCNLILALISLDYEKTEVSKLFNLLFNITKKKLPISNDYTFDMDLYAEIEKLPKTERVILLLVSRFNRLGIEKNHFSIYALSYMAKEHPKEFLNSISFLCNHIYLLLPMHRSILLQIVKDEISPSYYTDDFKISLMKEFPRDYFYENLLIHELCELNIRLPEISEQILLQSNENDDKFFPEINIRYDYLFKNGFSFDGLFNLFKIRRDDLSKQYNDTFYLRAEKVVIPNVAVSNAVYEILNNNGNNQLAFFFNYFENILHPFLLQNILMSCGANDKRPSFLPIYGNNETIQKIEISSDIMKYSDDIWCVLSYSDEQISGEKFKQKKVILTNYFIYFEEYLDALCEYTFNINHYFDNELTEEMGIISQIKVYDYMESHSIIFLSPYIMQKLNLHLNNNKFDGLYALDSENEIIAKMITWKTDYLGSLEDGVEIPKQNGTALLFRKDKLNLLQQLFSKNLKTVSLREICNQFTESDTV
jgi:hypothetical protein